MNNGKDKKRDDILSSQMEVASLLMDTEILQPKQEEARSCKKDWSLQGIDKDGKLFALTPQTLFWYRCNVLNGGNLNDKSSKQFRTRF